MALDEPKTLANRKEARDYLARYARTAMAVARSQKGWGGMRIEAFKDGLGGAIAGLAAACENEVKRMGPRNVATDRAVPYLAENENGALLSTRGRDEREAAARIREAGGSARTGTMPVADMASAWEGPGGPSPIKLLPGVPRKPRGRARDGAGIGA